MPEWFAGAPNSAQLVEHHRRAPRDGDPELVVTAQPVADPDEDEDFEARITLRLPASLKDLIEDHASASGDSINRWVVETLRSRAGRSRSGSRVQETFEL